MWFLSLLFGPNRGYFALAGRTTLATPERFAGTGMADAPLTFE
jgi:hypothetical protein